jgi:conjugal transfer pilus assembly protein TraW
MRWFSLVTLSAWLLLFPPVYGKDLGRYGQSYPIREGDAIVEMQQRAAAVDWAKVFDKRKIEKKVKDYRPAGLRRLPATKENQVRAVDMTYSTEFDIPDGKGGVLYPRGYTFNPLDYIFLPTTLVFIDGAEKSQIEWFRSSAYASSINVMLMLVHGPYWDLMESLERPVFYADEQMTRRFGVRTVPSVVVQNGRMMNVHEYAVRPGK